MRLIDDISSNLLQWYATIKRQPAASAGGASVGQTATIPPPKVATQDYTALIVMGAIGLVLVILLVMTLRK